MEVAQINARIDIGVKREGDAVLARLGVSATEAIRALWAYLAQAQALPAFMQKGQERQSLSTEFDADIVATGAGLALSMARDLGLSVDVEDVSYDELRRLAFEELVTEEASGV